MKKYQIIIDITHAKRKNKLRKKLILALALAGYAPYITYDNNVAYTACDTDITELP